MSQEIQRELNKLKFNCKIILTFENYQPFCQQLRSLSRCPPCSAADDDRSHEVITSDITNTYHCLTCACVCVTPLSIELNLEKETTRTLRELFCS